MVSLAGLSAAYPGFQQAQGVDLRNRQQQLTNQGLEDEQAGNVIVANMAKMFQQSVPGAQPMQGQAMAPPPGQQSMPAQPPVQDDPNPQPSRLDSAAWPQGPVGAPQPSAAPPAPSPAAGGMQPQPGAPLVTRMSIQQLMAAAAQANPGASPGALVAGIGKLVPWMRQDTAEHYKALALSLASQRVGQGADRIEVARTESERKQEQGDQRIGQGAQRIEQGAERIKQGASNFDRRENDRALDRVLKQKKDALTAQLAAERQQIFATAMGVSPAKLKKDLEIAQQRHEERLKKLEAEFAAPAVKPPAAPSDATVAPPAQGGQPGAVRRYNPATGKIE